MEVTDDERREVAERLRERAGRRVLNLGELLWCTGCDDGDDAAAWNRLADLIDPDTTSDTTKSAGDTTKAPTSSDAAPTRTDANETCDMSQSCRDTVACGIDSIYDWCFERLEGADGAEDELYCTIMRAIEDYRHPELATARTVRAVDREALLALADEMDDCGLDGWACGPVHVGGFARRIREALGVVA